MPHYYKSLLFLSNLISNGLQPDVVKKLSTKKNSSTDRSFTENLDLAADPKNSAY
jgi:hypothetical protein